MAKEEENIFEKFFGSNTLDLASAFWIFGVFVSAIAGFIFGYLSEAIHWLFIWAYYGIVLNIIIALVTIDVKYIQKKQEKKESAI